MNPFSLAGKRAVITGGSRGIGLGIARGLAGAGADLTIIGRDARSLEEARGELEASRRSVDVRAFDMARIAEIPDLYEELVRGAGPADILVNAAGRAQRGPAEAMSPEEWEEVIRLNLSSVFFMAQAFAKERIASGRPGKVINIASLTSEAARRGTAAYTASKGGIRQLTKALAVDWARHGILVNAIGPGYIRTDLTRPLQEDPEFDAWVRGRTPLGRWGEPADLAPTAVFLASAASDFITGQTIYVDGGWLATF